MIEEKLESIAVEETVDIDKEDEAANASPKSETACVNHNCNTESHDDKANCEAVDSKVVGLGEDNNETSKASPVDLAVEKQEAPVSDATERDFDKNPTSLFALLQKKEWDSAIERSRTHMDEASVWVSRREKDGRLRWRLLPIHAALVFKAPDNVAESLLGAFPKGAETKDDQGMLPLHLAFRNGSSTEVVNMLLVAYPQSIDVKDRKGRIPLVLAQASTSPHKDAFLEALERGPSYYKEVAMATERAAVTAEQQAIFDAEMMQIKKSHEDEISALKLAAEEKEKVLRVKLEGLEEEFLKTQETSQILVDHVNSLEAQLNSRSDTERFLATKIATLDSSLKNTEKGREETEYKLTLENHSLAAERDGYKLKYEELETKYEAAQTKLTESLNLLDKREEEWANLEEDLRQQVKSTQIDWANAQANCAIFDAQLKKKMETEHGLATQVSSLAGKLADSTYESRENTKKYTIRIKELEDERVVLRGSVQDLTKRLQLVAGVLQDMSNEQQKIMEESKNHEAAIADALEAHAKTVAEAMEQQHVLEEARREREEMKKILARQEEQVVANEEKRTTIINAIVAQGKHMERTKSARDGMLQSVKTMGSDCKVVLEKIMTVLPGEEVEDDNKLVDVVVGSLAPPIEKEEKESHGGEPACEPAVDTIPPSLSEKLTNDDEHTASTEKTSKHDIEVSSIQVTSVAEDRIEAAREGTV